MVDIGKILDGLKLSPKHLAPLAAAAGTILFGPPKLLAALGMAKFVDAYRPWIGVVFLVTGAILAVRATIAVWGSIKDRVWAARFKKSQERRLLDLTPDEKEVLRGFISQNTRTQNLDVGSGVVSGLVAEGIIYRSANVGSVVHGFDYNIQPWAWDYLREHPELLVGPSRPTTDPFGRRLTGR